MYSMADYQFDDASRLKAGMRVKTTFGWGYITDIPETAGVYARIQLDSVSTLPTLIHVRHLQEVEGLTGCECGKDKFQFEWHAKWCPLYTRPM